MGQKDPVKKNTVGSALFLVFGGEQISTVIRSNQNYI